MCFQILKVKIYFLLVLSVYVRLTMILLDFMRNDGNVQLVSVYE